MRGFCGLTLIASLILVRYKTHASGRATLGSTMKRQVRPFAIEYKAKRRGSSKPGGSIWGDFDLASIAIDSDADELTSGRIVDSSVPPVVSERHKSQAELDMSYPQEADTLQTTTEEPIGGEAPPAKKASRGKAAKVPGKRSARSKAAIEVLADAQVSKLSTKSSGRRTYSPNERAKKLADIETAIVRGDSVKAAAKQAGISEQTYYQWKKAAEPLTQSDGLKDLLALEEENRRLKNLLAERLRKENSELKKKLGLV